jgi:hypothetical protein
VRPTYPRKRAAKANAGHDLVIPSFEMLRIDATSFGVRSSSMYRSVRGSGRR